MEMLDKARSMAQPRNKSLDRDNPLQQRITVTRSWPGLLAVSYLVNLSYFLLVAV